MQGVPREWVREATLLADSAGANIALVSVCQRGNTAKPQAEDLFNAVAKVELSVLNLIGDMPSFAEIALKWVLNAITTGEIELRMTQQELTFSRGRCSRTG